MLSTVLAAYLALALPQQVNERPARPTDEQLIAAVLAEAPDSRILSSAFAATPRGGGWKGCGLIEVDGVVEPFSVVTLWKDAQPERPPIISSVRIRGTDGQMHDWAPPPTPAEPAEWDISAVVPTHADRAGDGFDRADRNYDIFERRMALLWCPSLTPPEGANWAIELEPHPDPEREGQINRQARQLTDLLMDAAKRRAAED